eukprot:m.162141 g.162141  ORF g.162141 m.162141 type:complete len:360 (+) comp38835_c0_seq12:1092-2171(+)
MNVFTCCLSFVWSAESRTYLICLIGVWKEIKAKGRKPSRRLGAAMVEIDESCAFVHGGQAYIKKGDTYFDNSYLISLKENEWKKVTFDHQPSARSDHTLCRLKGRLFKEKAFVLLTGSDPVEEKDMAYVLDIEGRKSYQLTDVECVSRHTVHCVEDRNDNAVAFLFGGMDENGECVKSIIKSLLLGMIIKCCSPLLRLNAVEGAVEGFEKYMCIDAQCFPPAYQSLFTQLAIEKSKRTKEYEALKKQHEELRQQHETFRETLEKLSEDIEERFMSLAQVDKTAQNERRIKKLEDFVEKQISERIFQNDWESTRNQTVAEEKTQITRQSTRWEAVNVVRCTDNLLPLLGHNTPLIWIARN